MEVNSRPTPTNIIELGIEYAELVIKRSDSNEYQYGEGYFLSERFGHLTDGNVIIVCDMFLGTERRIAPKSPNNIVIINIYARLTLNRGFIVYGTSTDPGFHRHTHACDSIHAALISIDFDDETYEFIGNSYEFLNGIFVYWTSMFHPLPNIIMVICGHNIPWGVKLYIFKLNGSLSTINFQQSIEIPFDSRWFHQFEGKIVFARGGSKIVFCFTYMNEDNSLVEIENTGTLLRGHSTFDISNFSYAIDSIAGCWHETKCFVSYNLASGHLPENLSILAIPLLWVFEMVTKQWSEIRLNFLLNKYSYRFGVDLDGFLNVISYGQHLDADESSRYSVSLTRISLKKPDKLLNLCWFKIRGRNLSERFKHLQNLV